MRPNPTEHHVFTGRMPELRELTGFVERFCREHAVDDNARWHLVLVVEELFTNTVTHGYRGGADAPVEISLACERGGVTLLYEDAAPPFNPLDLPVTAAAAAPEARPVGGLGVLLVAQLTRDMRYTYEAGRNRLSLRVPATGLAS